jgi:hypothetical protein
VPGVCSRERTTYLLGHEESIGLVMTDTVGKCVEAHVSSSLTECLTMNLVVVLNRRERVLEEHVADRKIDGSTEDRH